MCTKRARHEFCLGGRMMNGLLLGAFIGGLAGSPHCIGMCGGFAVAGSDAPVAYHLGRLATYVVLGTIAGALGAAIPGPPWATAAVSGVMLLVFSLRLSGLMATPHIAQAPGFSRVARLLRGGRGWPGRLALGASTALLPCGLVWAAMGIAVATGHAAGGAFAMVAFWLGTVPALSVVATGLFRFSERGKRGRIALSAAVFLAGLWSISQRMPAEASDDGAAPACHETH